MNARWLLLTLFCSASVLACPNTNGKLSVCQEVSFNDTRFVWMSLFQQTNNADAGENVALYTQQLKYGKGNSWGSVSEIRCVNHWGGCHGHEVDLVVNGPLAWGDWRTGQSIVIWKLPGSEGQPQANFGLLVAPQWDERENIRVDVGIGVQTRHNIAAVQIRSGEKIALDDSGKIAIRFNPTTQQIEFLNGERVLQSIPVN